MSDAKATGGAPGGGGAAAGDMPAFPRPLPRPSAESARFWTSLRSGRIELPRCTSCGKLIFYPRSFCPHCLGRDVAWQEIDGRGSVYTFTVVHKPTNPYFMGSAPYVYAVVELEAGVRLPTMLVGCAPAEVRIGAPVEAVFEPVDDAVTLLYFRPRTAHTGAPEAGSRKTPGRS